MLTHRFPEKNNKCCRTATPVDMDRYAIVAIPTFQCSRFNQGLCKVYNVNQTSGLNNLNTSSFQIYQQRSFEHKASTKSVQTQQKGNKTINYGPKPLSQSNTHQSLITPKKTQTCFKAEQQKTIKKINKQIHKPKPVIPSHEFQTTTFFFLVLPHG